MDVKAVCHEEENLFPSEPFDKMASLPEWNELPEIPLYMDQVLFLLNRYLYPVQQDFHEEKSLTPSMINNYIKSRLLPPSVRKRYSRPHLAALLMICCLKESVAISDIPLLLGPLDSDEGIRNAYEAFRTAYQRSFERIKAMSRPPLDHEGPPDTSRRDRVLDLALSANLCKTLTGLCLHRKQEPEQRS